MSYTSPSNSDSDMVRFLIQDTDTTAESFTDAEIADVLDIEGGVYPAALMLVDQLLMRAAQKPSTRIGSLAHGAEVVGQLEKARARIVARMSKASGASPVTWGGATTSEQTTDEANTSLVQPVFTRDQHDYPGTED